MFTRIVKMTFEIEFIPAFLDSFDKVKDKIRAFEGCEFLELYQDKKDPTIFFTYSRWRSEVDLDNYRNSELFQQVWSLTKSLFRAKAEAWSVDTLVHLD
jgi:autoinducer 2-degrading protein